MSPGTNLGAQRLPPTREGAFSAPILPLELRDVCYEVGGARLIDGISLTIETGPRTLILGPNGAGKSLLLRLAHGLLRPSAGQVLWRNRKIAGAGRGPRRQAMVFQKPVLLRRSVRANLDHALALHRIGGEERRQRRREALQATGLSDRGDQPARSLSGGEQQRLALARAWALKPQVLFLDEPTSALDPASTRAVEEIVQALHAAGTKIVMTTHDLGQARRLADEVVFLNRGRLLEQGPADRFFTQPQSREAEAYLAGELLW
ncbi:tungstate transport system ATP-binding protein [Tistlia consotensis]|uniref:Tungstate transport system ATP-binding protein n=1 Tax=Tistlia consotensis USBA 355 TaxID=560819 RepID=A0A1Y6BQI1_9PROT|nr:ATP-binding cassette domain-containing protein [Tistlia consotensis]SMF23738.1 tungstate transport system ATP-binding protein [Tistlia consotensis USBA 355]SNR61317.1 tungstate transport system ATP-binding protein [Tistlia consotensis]